MSINLKKWLLGLGLNLLTACTASAQIGSFTPLNEPSDFQYFVQPDLSNYGSGVQPHYGWFGGIDYILWSTTAPNRTQIGNSEQLSPALNPGERIVYNGNYGYTLQTNSLDTGFIKAAMQSGTRFEIGFMDDCDKGWFFSGYRLNPNTSNLTATNVSMVFREDTRTLFDNRNPAVGNGDSGFEAVGFAPILYGFVDNQSGIAGGVNLNNQTAINNPDGIADDVDRDNTFGPYGVDTGTTTQTANPPPVQVFDRIPNFNRTDGAAYLPIDYGDLVPLPVLFGNVNVQHRTSNYSLEFNRQWRLVTGKYGGNIDVFAGPRYINFNDQFLVDAIGGILADSYWNARTDNRIIGGQVGFRANKKNGRLTLSTEGRLFTGADLQTVRLDGQIGSKLNQTIINPLGVTGTSNSPNGTNDNTGNAAIQIGQNVATVQPNNPGQGTMAVRLNQPLNLNRTTFSSSRNFVNFTPLGELRFKAQYQVWETVNVNAGWTGTFMDGIMRSNNMIDYNLPAFGISNQNRVQGVFMNGFNLGLEWNR